MPARTTASTHDPYPSHIRLFPRLGHKKVKQLDPWDVLEFFRIEALRRSKPVLKIYLKGQGQGEQELDDCYHVKWGIFSGEHHNLLQSSDRRKRVHPLSLHAIWNPVRDIGAVITRHPPDSELSHLAQAWATDPLSPLVAFDSTRKLQPILKAVQSQHEKTHKEFLRAKKESASLTQDYLLALREWENAGRAVPQFKRKRKGLADLKKRAATATRLAEKIQKLDRAFPGLRRARMREFCIPSLFETWRPYFRCHDLHARGVSHPEIAKRLYGTVRKRKPRSGAVQGSYIQRRWDWVEFAISRVEELIEYATRDIWPPPLGAFRRKRPRRA